MAAVLALSSLPALAGFSTPRIISGGNDLGNGDYYNPNLSSPLGLKVGFSGTVYATWKGYTTYRAQYIKSTDKGDSWTVAAPFTPEGISLNTFDLIEGLDGKLYVAYGIIGDRTHFHFTASGDGGETWSTPVTVGLGTSTVGSDFTLAATSDGLIHVAWTDPETERTVSGQKLTGGYYVRTYTPETMSWGEVSSLAANLDIPSERARFAGLGNKAVYTLHGYYLGGGSGVAAYAAWNGTSWGRVYMNAPDPEQPGPAPCEHIVSLPCDPCSYQWYMLAAPDQAGNLFLLEDYHLYQDVWHLAEGPNQCTVTRTSVTEGQRLVRKLLSSGATHSVFMNEDNIGWDRAVAATGAGAVHVFYLDRTSGDLKYRTCAVCGEVGITPSWTPAASLNTASQWRDGDDPQAATGPDGTVYVVWEYGAGRVLFSSSSDYASQGGKPVGNLLLLLSE